MLGVSPIYSKNKKLGLVPSIAKMKVWDLFEKCDIEIDNNSKGLKVAKEDQRLIGSMVSRLRLDG